MAISFSYLKNQYLKTLQALGATDSPTFVTVDLTGITNGNVPYMGASGFANSPMSINGNYVGIGTTAAERSLHIAYSTGAIVGGILLEDTNPATASKFLITRNYINAGFHIRDLTQNKGRFSIAQNGNVGFSETDPVTHFEMTGTAPYITLHNSTNEDTDGGRESRIIARGQQSGGEETILGYMEFAHESTGDDEKGLWRVLLNDGNDGTTPSKTGITIKADGGVYLNSLKSGANQGAAGAATGELWIDTADQTVKVGV
jgi:hypothetical protein